MMEKEMKAILLDVNVNLKLNKMKSISTWLNKDVKPQTKENVYIPALSVNDADRKRFFTTYNVELMQSIREVKLKNS
jgi:hypothetical protein